jgi:hypothetical protein
MPTRHATQFEIQLPGGKLTVPRKPVDVPSEAYFIWPFNLRSGDITVRYSTAQLFMRLATEAGTTLYFEAIQGIPVEFAIDAAGVRSVKAASGERASATGVIYLSGINPGIESSIDVVSDACKKIHIVVFTAKEAEDAWKIRIGREEHVFLSEQDFFANPDTKGGPIWLRSRDTTHFAFSIMPPPPAAPKASFKLTPTGTTNRAASFAADLNEVKPTLEYRQVQTAGEVPPVKLGPVADWRPAGVAQAPDASELKQAAKWSIVIPAGSIKGLSELFLQIKYEGDVARLSAAHKLLTDDFYNGLGWQVGLQHFLDPQRPSAFELSILPLRKDAPVYFETPGDLDFSTQGQVVKLESVSLVPEYQLVVNPGGR